VRIIHRSRYFL